MKSFSLKSSSGIAAIVFAIAALIALPLRTIQYFTIIENNGTGFYKQTDWTVYVIGFILAVAVITLLVLGFINKKNFSYDLEVKSRPLFGLFSFVAAAGIFSDGIVCVLNADKSNLLSRSRDLEEFIGILLENSDIPFMYAEAILSVFAAIFLLALGISTLTGKTNGSEHKLISLIPVIWCLIRMIFRFSRTISYLRVSELTFELLMLVFSAMFFMAFAQVNSQIGSKNSEWKLLGYGLPAALFALVCFVPRLIVWVSGQRELLYEYAATPNICELSNALFIITTVFTRLSVGAKKEEEIPEDVKDKADA